MNKTCARILTCLIPSRSLRQKLRKKLTTKSHAELLEEIQAVQGQMQEQAKKWEMAQAASIEMLRKSIDDMKERQKQDITALSTAIKQDITALSTAIKREINLAVRITTDVTKMPQAKGFFRTLQLLNLEILEEIDRICRANDIKYWLAFGTALGAIRHGGHIPWDDDIDICMMYEDWQKFHEVCKTQMREPFVDTVLPGDIGRVCRRDFMPSTDEEWINFVKWTKNEKLFFGVDIFPVFWLKEDVSNEDATKLLREQSDIKQRMRWENEHTVELWQKAHDEAQAAIEPIIGAPGSSRVFVSLHTYLSKVTIWEARDIFPLRDITFEGKPFWTARNIEVQLLQSFGDYWEPVLTHTHLAVAQLCREEKVKLVEQAERLGCL